MQDRTALVRVSKPVRHQSTRLIPLHTSSKTVCARFSHSLSFSYSGNLGEGFRDGAGATFELWTR